jgi:hypothetical protein
MHVQEVEPTGVVVLFVFLFYVLIGACFMPIIEDIDFITSVYTNVMSVTAVDFSIIVGGKYVLLKIISVYKYSIFPLQLSFISWMTKRNCFPSTSSIIEHIE